MVALYAVGSNFSLIWPLSKMLADLHHFISIFCDLQLTIYTISAIFGSCLHYFGPIFSSDLRQFAWQNLYPYLGYWWNPFIVYFEKENCWMNSMMMPRKAINYDWRHFSIIFVICQYFWEKVFTNHWKFIGKI